MIKKNNRFDNKLYQDRNKIEIKEKIQKYYSEIDELIVF